MKKFLDNGFGTKILPEAIDWHFGGVWKHILPRFEQYKDVDLEKDFEKTGRLLRSSICLNIPVNMTDETIDELVNVLIKPPMS